MLDSTLSQFTSPSFPSKEKCCLCHNYSRPWSNWAPTTSTYQELAIEGSRDLKSIYPAPQRVFSVSLGFTTYSGLSFSPSNVCNHVHSFFISPGRKENTQLHHVNKFGSCVSCASEATQECVNHCAAGNYQQLRKWYHRYHSWCPK